MIKPCDFDLARWKEYPDLLTESLWILGARSKDSAHVGDYWGNFVPQIPRQILRRFTSPGDWIVDLFSGMGTTLIECRILGRNGIGVDLNEDVVRASRERLGAAGNPGAACLEILQGDATHPDTVGLVREVLARGNRTDADCVFLHPPYHNIIRFSRDRRDLSNARGEGRFLEAFQRSVTHATSLVRPGGHVVLVIGDIFRRGQVRPLGFLCMEMCRRSGLELRAINVKDIQNTRGKGHRTNLWRYRAFKEGLYVFRHEYVMLFRRPLTGEEVKPPPSLVPDPGSP